MKYKKLEFTILILIIYFNFFGIVKNLNAEIIFEDNFDSHDDWSVPYTNDSKLWPTAQVSDFPSGNPLSGIRMIGYSGQASVITGQTNPRMHIFSDAGRGGSGKGLRMQCEAIYGDDSTHSVWYSDNQIYYTLSSTPGESGYTEVWIQMWRRYQTNFYSKPGGIKYLRASHFRGDNLNDWHYDDEADVDHAPYIIVDTTNYDDTPACCIAPYDYDDLTQDFEPLPKFTFREDGFTQRADYAPTSIAEGNWHHTSSGTVYVNHSHNVAGDWRDAGNYGDGDWHYHEMHIKMNSEAGVADGVFGYYIDGVAQIVVNNVPWVQSTGTLVDWNMFSLGGNQDFHTSILGGETYYYDIDDLIISNHRVGQDYIIGESDTTPPSNPTGLSVE